MKKYLVIGNPIDHSLSPKLHNYWLRKNNIDATYEKLKLNHNEIQKIIFDIKNHKISGINVTVPFKKDVIPFLDNLSEESMATNSVNTVFLKDGKVIGHNTDIIGFDRSLKKVEFDLKNKKILILGAGGVVPSIIYSLKKSGVSNIMLCNRTKSKADSIKKIFADISVINWGELPEFDMIVNATSLGLNENDKIDLNFSNIDKNKLFYDVIYNPVETNFLKIGKNLGAKVMNGKMMFVYQAFEAFRLWHKINPKIDDEVLKLID